jgi:leucyl aminopeptidase
MKIRIATAPAKAGSAFPMVMACEGAKPDGGPTLAKAVAACVATGDVDGAWRKVGLFHPGTGPSRMAIVGLGKPKDLTAERLRRAAAVAQAAAEEAKQPSFLLVVPGELGAVTAEAAGAAVAEGLVLGAYRFEPPRKEKPKARNGQECEVVYLGADARAFQRGFEFGRIGAEATVFARDLENQAANHCTPTALAQAAKKLAGRGVRVKVLDRKAMERLGMGALLGVARGSDEPPRFILMEYGPATAKDTVCVVGKGLTFDTGGISIKPAAKMDEMRYDMCGAGAVLGLFHALHHGGLQGAARGTRIVGLIPATENMPGASAQKPGDVVTAMDGHTIEVLNTDAEGRLVLADAIAYARRFYKPKQIVDLATLTGAVVVALGHELAGIMGNDQELCDELIAAGKAADEPLWQLPLWDCHKEQVKSRFADLANIAGPQYGAGTIAGASFLSFFAGDTPWVHLDIAGTAWGATAKDYYRTGAAGTAVRTLLHWVRTRR